MAITPADVYGWLGEAAPTGAKLAALERVVDAVEAMATRPAVDGGRYSFPAGELPADAELGLIMQAARLWKRKGSPEGITGNADIGVIYVSRFDADIEDLVGPWCQTGAA